MSPLVRQVEALLFLSPDPVALDELADAVQAGEEAVQEALSDLAGALDGRGVVLREVGGGWTLASHPDAEEAARRLLARPRTPALTPAQAETLAIVGYLQPVSRPEVARIRGVASESATAALVERGLIDEFHFWIFPVLAGTSDSMYDGLGVTHLHLRSTTTFKSRLVVHAYEPEQN